MLNVNMRYHSYEINYWGSKNSFEYRWSITILKIYVIEFNIEFWFHLIWNRKEILLFLEENTGSIIYIYIYITCIVLIKSRIWKFSNIDSDSDEIVIDDHSILNWVFIEVYSIVEMIIFQISRDILWWIFLSKFFKM